MASKKYLLLAALALLTTVGVKAQDGNSGMYRGGGYDFSDTTLIPEKRLPQHRDFLNNQYDFPAKPRNQWEIGISGGMLNVSGDVKSRSLFNGAVKPLNTLGFGLSVRKAWGYVISTRLQYIHGSASGYNWSAGSGYIGHGQQNPWERLGYTSPVYYNYKTTINELSLQVVAALNNLKFHRARNKVSYYALAGVGGMTYNTMVDALNESGGRYDVQFDAIRNKYIANGAYDSRKDINKDLRDLFDGDYETEAEGHSDRGKLAGGTLRGIATVGAGFQIRLSKRLSLQVEDKVTMTSDDLVDGQRWQEWPSTGGSAMTREMDNVNYFSVGLGINLGGKSVDPLWWMNPLDYGYNEMKHIKPADGKCDKDADGDGISDCFDRCPNTPGGVSVDSHGCPFDTDGDGVFDYKDKQLITPTECQPVDADGVGKCPCPDPDCFKGMTQKTDVGCGSIPSGSISFTAGSPKLGSSAMNQLNSLASAMRANPNCKAVIIGNGNGSKVEQQRSWDRVNSVINYMVEKQGIDRERFIFQYGNATGDANSVDYRSAGPDEVGPSNVPPPHPNLRK